MPANPAARMAREISIRVAVAGDIPEILRQRRGMYEDMGYKDADSLSAMLVSCESYLTAAILDGSFRGWIAQYGEQAIGGGAVLISPWPSHPYDLECRRATILNVYVYPEFRRKGIARKLTQIIVDWCREQGMAAAYLHASKSGRPLYESLGFEPTNEMRLKLR